MQPTRFRWMDLAVAVSLGGLVIALLTPAVAQTRTAARATSCSNNFKQIGLALHNYHDTNNLFPPGRIWGDPKKFSKDPTNDGIDRGVGLAVLPYMEQGGLYNSFNFQLSWHAAANKTACTTKVAAYFCPEDAATTSTATLAPPGQATNIAFPLGTAAWMTHPSANRGPKPEGLFFDNSTIGIRDIVDGTANTVMASEQLIDQVRRSGPGDGGDCSGTEVEPKSFADRTGTRWMTGHPSSNYFTARRAPNDASADCFEGVSPTGIGSLNKVARSRHANGVHVLRADGGVSFVLNNIDLSVWRAVNTRAGAERIDGEVLNMLPSPSRRPPSKPPGAPAAKTRPAQAPERDPAEADETTPLGKLKRIALAAKLYHDAHGVFPHASVAFTGDKGLSWRVWLLPYFGKPELTKLYNQFRLNQPWDSPHNIKLVARMPDIYTTPDAAEPGKSAFHVFTGADTPFGGDEPVRDRDIIDGTAHTIMAVLGQPLTATEWTRPGGIEFRPDTNPAGALGKVDDKHLIVMISGDVRRMRADLPHEAWSLLIQHDDRNTGQLMAIIESMNNRPAGGGGILSRLMTTLFTGEAQSPGVVAPRSTPLVTRPVEIEPSGRYVEAMAELDAAIRRNPQDAAALIRRGNAWANRGSNDKAIADFTEAIRLKPNSAAAHTSRGASLAEQADYERALDDFSQAIQLDPQLSEPLNGQAWIWATCPDAQFRHGKKAIESATRACELDRWRRPASLGTLAAAFAETGDFASAVKWQTKATDLTIDPADKAGFRVRLELYRAGKPFRQTPRQR